MGVTHFHRNDYVLLRLHYPFTFDVHVVASDQPGLYDKNDPECWIVAVHDNDWTKVGNHVSTNYVEKHSPRVLYRDPEEKRRCSSCVGNFA